MRPDPQSPVPLYHQLVESLRYRIATGQLRPGDRLPSLRDGSQQWRVNLHTVRRAYGELARLRLIEVRRPHAARILGTGPEPGASTSGLDGFLRDTLRQARERFGLGAAGLADLIRAGHTPYPPHRLPRATLVECSDLQAADYAQQIAARWGVRMASWSLDRRDEPPPGAVISTYFHFNDVRSRWPDRRGDLHFVPVHLDPDLAGEIAKRGGPRAKCTLVETSRERAHELAGDLSAILSPLGCALTTRVVSTPGSMLEKRARHRVLLFAPRLWSRLTDRQRSDPRSLQVRYLLDDSAVERLAGELGWAEQGRSGAR